jgi:phosphatidylserine/phosphatidylglycerophosphate/cardiolipin synthase-like enzyme
MSHHLLVFPDDTAKPLIDALDAAREFVNIRMFLFTDPSMVAAVKAAQQRGVKVRVMLNPQRRDGSAENEETRRALEGSGVEVRDSSPAFALTHQKSMVVDRKIGYVESLNWETRDLTQTRDYAVVVDDALEVSEMLRCFEADWSQQPFQPDPASRLIWCPNNGRQRIAAFIDSARQSLTLQNERYQDTVIVERLVRALARGVKVHVMARPPHNLKADKLLEGVGGLRIMRDVGAKVHCLEHLKLHGKMLLADEARAVIGSINLAPGSFDERRELAIETESPQVIERLTAVVRHDWKHSLPLDLSDEGVLADLAKRHQDRAGARALALKGGAKKPKK